MEQEKISGKVGPQKKILWKCLVSEWREDQARTFSKRLLRTITWDASAACNPPRAAGSELVPRPAFRPLITIGLLCGSDVSRNKIFWCVDRFQKYQYVLTLQNQKKRFKTQCIEAIRQIGSVPRSLSTCRNMHLKTQGMALGAKNYETPYRCKTEQYTATIKNFIFQLLW